MNNTMSAHSAPIPSKVKKFRRHRLEERRQWVQLQERSGQTLKTFCAENGLGLSTLLLWRRQLRTREDVSPGQNRLVEVPINMAAHVTPTVCVHLPRGIRLDVQPGVDATWLAQLLGKLCLPE